MEGMSALTELKKELEAVESWISESENDLQAKNELRRQASSQAVDAAQVLQDLQDQAERYRSAIAALEDLGDTDRG